MEDRFKALALGLLCAMLGSLLAVKPAMGGAFAPASSGWTTVTKSSDETRTTNTTVTADSTLTFPVLANTKYRFRVLAFFTSPSTPDFKFSVLGPSSPTVFLCRYQRGGLSSFDSDHACRTSYPSAITVPSASDQSGYIEIDGVLHNGSNAGTIDFGWAQDTSDAGSTIVRAGSHIEYKVVQ